MEGEGWGRGEPQCAIFGTVSGVRVIRSRLRGPKTARKGSSLGAQLDGSHRAFVVG